MYAFSNLSVLLILLILDPSLLLLIRKLLLLTRFLFIFNKILVIKKRKMGRSMPFVCRSPTVVIFAYVSFDYVATSVVAR